MFDGTEDWCRIWRKTDLYFQKWRGLEFLSYEIELRNRVTQIDVTLQITNSKILMEILLSSY